jgi:hypothetical protein
LPRVPMTALSKERQRRLTCSLRNEVREYCQRQAFKPACPNSISTWSQRCCPWLRREKSRCPIVKGISGRWLVDEQQARNRLPIGARPTAKCEL